MCIACGSVEHAELANGLCYVQPSSLQMLAPSSVLSSFGALSGEEEANRILVSTSPAHKR